MIGIYKITSPTGRVYIGQSVNIEKRLKQHKNINNKDNVALNNSFIKHGIENHTFEVIEECEVDELNERERYWQDYYDVLKYGLNCKLTTSNSKSGLLSDSVKNKISKSKKGVKLSKQAAEKVKIRMNNNHPMKGITHSKESRLKMSNSRIGKKNTIESLNKKKETIKNRCPVYSVLISIKISDSLRGTKKPARFKEFMSKKMTKRNVTLSVRNKISNTLKGKMTGYLNGNSKMLLDLTTGFYYGSITEFIKSNNLTINKYNKIKHDRVFVFKNK